MKLTLSSLLLTLCLLTCTANSVEVTTGNILNNSTFGTGTQYSETGWDVTGYDNHHDDLGSGTINNAPGGSFAAGVDSEISQSVTLSTDAEMNQKEIQNGFSSTLGADIWFWNNYNNTITLEQKITGSDGSVTTQTRIIPTANCGFSNCNQYNNYTDTHIQGSNTQTDFDIEVTVKNQGTGYTSGHLGPDIDDVTLSVTYTDIDLIDEDAQEAIDDIDENIPDIEDDFTWEEEFTFEEEYFTWEEDFYFEEDFNMEWEDEYIVGDWEMDYEMEFNEDMYFEEEFVEMEMPEEFEEFDMTMMPEEEFVEMYFEEEFDEGAFMEMPEEFEEMEMEEEFTCLKMEMEEEFEEMEVMEEEPTEMEVVEEEETIDMETETEEDVVEMEAEEEEMEVAENDDSIQEPKEDEESSEGTEEAVEEEPESEESVSKTVENEEESVEETDVADEGGITTKNIEVSKEIKIKNVDVGEIKISIDPSDIFKEVVNLDSYSNKDFYQDKGLQYDVNDDFFDQLSMIEYSKEIYKGVTLVLYIQGDPIEIYKQELEELAIQKAGIMIELKLLRGE
jgi:hypothetical protein